MVELDATGAAKVLTGENTAEATAKALLAAAWAAGTAPGGVGTKSAREYSEDAAAQAGAAAGIAAGVADTAAAIAPFTGNNVVLSKLPPESGWVEAWIDPTTKRGMLMLRKDGALFLPDLRAPWSDNLWDLVPRQLPTESGVLWSVTGKNNRAIFAARSFGTEKDGSGQFVADIAIYPYHISGTLDLALYRVRRQAQQVRPDGIRSVPGPIELTTSRTGYGWTRLPRWLARSAEGVAAVGMQWRRTPGINIDGERYIGSWSPAAAGVASTRYVGQISNTGPFQPGGTWTPIASPSVGDYYDVKFIGGGSLTVIGTWLMYPGDMLVWSGTAWVVQSAPHGGVTRYDGDWWDVVQAGTYAGIALAVGDKMVAYGGPYYTRYLKVAAGRYTVRGEWSAAGAVTNAAVGAAISGNAGNGTIGAVSAGTGAVAGVYRAQFFSATGFNVIGPNGVILTRGSVGTAYVGQVQFTITAGGTAFAAGDAFAITVTSTVTPPSFPAPALDNDLFQVTAPGTVGGIAFAIDDYAARKNGTWARVATTTITTTAANEWINLPVHLATDEWEARRTDKSTSIFPIRLTAEMQQSIEPAFGKTVYLYSDSMGRFLSTAFSAALATEGLSLFAPGYVSAGAEEVVQLIEADIRQGIDPAGQAMFLWYGQNNETATARIAAADARVIELMGPYCFLLRFSWLGRATVRWDAGLGRFVGLWQEPQKVGDTTNGLVQNKATLPLLFPGRWIDTWATVIAGVTSTLPHLQYPGMTEAQVAAAYGQVPLSYYFDWASMGIDPTLASHKGTWNTAGLPTGGSPHDYYRRIGGIADTEYVGNMVYNVAGTWTEVFTGSPNSTVHMMSTCKGNADLSAAGVALLKTLKWIQQ